MSSLTSAFFASILSGFAPHPASAALPAPRLLDTPSLHALDSQTLAALKSSTEALLSEHGIEGVVTARRKSSASVAAKMQRKGVGFDQIFDRIGLRVIVGTEAECYAVRDLLHAQFAVVLGEDDDYIASPKANGYQSLHTAVYAGPHGEAAELQVRTFAMHEHAERGGASHAVYKARLAS